MTNPRLGLKVKERGNTELRELRETEDEIAAFWERTLLQLINALNLYKGNFLYYVLAFWLFQKTT